MPVYLKQRWVLLLVLAVFIILKWPHLYYPFFWDESWPYASGVYRMFYAGPSLVPGTITGELSRGHPLMFHFLAACWMKIFGTSHFAMHAYPLFISVLFLIVIYESCLRLFNVRAAIIAIVLVAFQQIFFVQSAMLLLEMQLAFLGFTAIYFYSIQRYFWASLALFMLFFTKESGTVVGAVLGIDALVRLFNRDIPFGQRLKAIACIAVPCLLLGLFFVVQKQVSGWYVLPMYSDVIENNWEYYYYKFRGCAIVFFRDDYRRFYFMFILALSIWAAITKKQLAYLMPWLLLPFAGILVSDNYHWLIYNYILVPIYIASFLYVVYKMARLFGFTGSQIRFVMLNAAFVMAFSLFTPFSLLIYRYLLIAFVPVLVISAVYVSYLFQQINSRLMIPVSIVIIALACIPYTKERKLGDISMGAFDAMDVQQKTIDYITDHNMYNKHIVVTQFLQWQHLLDMETGFKKDNKPFKDISGGKSADTEVLLFDNIECDFRPLPDYKLTIADTNFSCTYRITKGLAVGEIYQRKPGH